MFSIALSFCFFCLLSRLVSLPGIMSLQSSSHPGCLTVGSVLFLIGSHFTIATGGEMKMLLPGLLLSIRLLGAVTIFRGNGVAAAICLWGLLSVGLSVGNVEAFGNARSVGWSVGDARCTVTFWLLLLYPTAKWLGLGHSEHCGFSHGFSPYLPQLCGGVIWCIFWVTISWCMSW
jgi:hypothetical protein